jgi:hypothetical protein
MLPRIKNEVSSQGTQITEKAFASTEKQANLPVRMVNQCKDFRLGTIRFQVNP